MAAAIPELEAHRRAQEAFAGVLADVKADQLDDPTPCADWTVRDLIGHVVGGNQRVSSLEPHLSDDITGLIDDHTASARAAQAMFEAPDGLTRTYELRIGEIPGTVVIGLRTADALTHAWDLARATGQPTDIDPELAAQMLEVSRQLIRPGFRGPGAAFAEEQPCEGGSAADRLAAFLGRQVG